MSTVSTEAAEEHNSFNLLNDQFVNTDQKKDSAEFSLRNLSVILKKYFKG